jgi:fumarylpyruvate hydrolase
MPGATKSPTRSHFFITSVINMSYAIELWDTPSLSVVGKNERFPVRHVFCVGRNYAEHAKEMGHDASKEPPFFFTKSAHAVVPVGAGGVTLPYPQMTENLHHEIEMTVAIGKAGRDIKPEHALDHVYGYGVGLDMTRRDLQQVAKDMRRPWSFGKDFDAGAPMGPIHPVAGGKHPSGAIWLKVNGEDKQEGKLSDMNWSVADMIAYLSKYYELQPGHVIMSGTPAGVGPVVHGDVLVGHVDGLGEIEVRYSK